MSAKLESDAGAGDSGVIEACDLCFVVELVAAKEYGPSSWEDAEACLCREATFLMPATIPVTDGNAGNHWTDLSYREAGTGTTVTCRYKGGSSQAHPSSPAQILLGLNYVFQSCDNGKVAGDAFTTDYVWLHVANGDSWVGRTEVQLSLLEPAVGCVPTALPTPAAELSCATVEDDCDNGLDDDGDGDVDCADSDCETTVFDGCDGLDDDCDGAIDEAFVPTATSCGIGACAAAGATVCVDGAIADDCAPGPPTGLDLDCDGVDQDCDGASDEGYVSVPVTCGLGVCVAAGDTLCVEGSATDDCEPGLPTGSDAMCDGVDEDCDGAVDETYSSVGTSCGVGACAASGSTSCAGGTVQDSCTPGTPAPDDASCNAVDEDCDGASDEDYANTSTSCGVGACASSGTTSCVSGSVEDSCTPGTPAAADSTCDGIDDDCDAVDDEDYAPVPTSCGVGVCASTGSTSCTDGTVADSCAPGSPTGDDGICNAQDDDCDGLTDESYTDVPTSCGIGACVAAGALVCSGGSPTDTCTPGTPAADDGDCDGVDDDCDGEVDEDCGSRVSCVDFGATCGTIDDGFGGTLECGSCVFPETCGGGGTPNVCGVAELPPDPATVAPPAPSGVRDAFFDAFSFFFDGTNPVQQGADVAAFEPHRAAAIRGLVLDTDGDPLPGVRVEVLDHPELGWTFSRADGRYDLLVNGGGQVVLVYTEDNYLPVQRRLPTTWHVYGNAPDVVMTRVSAHATPVVFDSTSPQLVTGDIVTDTDGTREASVYFPPGVTAAVLVDGTTTPIETGRFRATEYTVGGSGVLAMPGDLRRPTLYTYAVELSLDEAGVGGEVQFSAPVSVYLDNFLSFPVGAALPLGSYDRELGMWSAETDGLVGAVVGMAGDLAEIDLTGDGTAEPESELAAWGFDEHERRTVATRFGVGESFWRVLVDHFTPYDCNLNGRRRLAPDPRDPELVARLTPECEATAAGSIIGCASQTLAEEVPLAGTDLTLRYATDRVRANTLDERTLRIDLSGYAPGPNADGIEVFVEVLGRVLYDATVPPGTPEVVIEWDGLDAFGRAWHRPVQARVLVESLAPDEYALFPAAAGALLAGSSFGRLGEACTLNSDPCCVSTAVALAYMPGRSTGNGYESRLTFTLGAVTSESVGLGGFGLTDYHAYSPYTGELFLGSGVARRDTTAEALVRVVAGGESDANRLTETEPGTASESDIDQPWHVAVGPSGTIYFVSDDGLGRGQIWAASPSDQLIPILANETLTPEAWSMWQAQRAATGAGSGGAGFIAVDANENIYFLSKDPRNRVFRIRRENGETVSIDFVAGPPNGGGPVWQDGDPLVGRNITVSYIAARPDGTLLLVHGRTSNTHEIVERRPDGTGVILATGGKFAELDVGPDGRIYVAYDGVPDGVHEVLPDGTSRRLAIVSGAKELAVAPNGDIFVSNQANDGPLHRIRAGRVERISFGGIENPSFSPPALTGPWGGAIRGLAATPYGSVVIVETGKHRIVERRFAENPVALRVPSEDASEVYYFDETGLHLRTDDALTGVTLRSFEHDADRRLTSITDADGQVTTITRPDASTVVLSAPAGSGGVPVTTIIALDANGYADTITDPEGAVWAFDYDPDGLLRRTWRPRQNAAGVRSGTPSEFDYERTDGPRAQALLVRNEDPEGGVQTLSSTHHGGDVSPATSTWCDGTSYVSGWNISNIWTEVERTTATGEVFRYRTSRATPGDRITHTITDPSGRAESYTERNGAHERTQTWPGGSLTTTEVGDPVVGSEGRYTSAATLTVNAVAGRSKLTLNRSAIRTATVAFAAGVELGDVLAWQEDTTLNGTATSTVQYDGPTRTLRSTSAEGRESEVVLDTDGRIVETRLPGQLPTVFSYDAHGRLLSAVRTDGTTERRVDYEYDPRGYLSRVTAPASATQLVDTRYPDNDLRGLPREVQIVGGGTTEIRRDVEGFVSGVTPPTQPEHELDYSGIGLATEYRPPGVMSTPTPGDCPAGAECVVYDGARRIATFVRADGATVTPSYHATSGLVTSVADSADGTWGYTYDGAARVTGVSAPDGSAMSFGWQSDLPIFSQWSGTHTVVRDGSTVWTGTVSGRVDAHYNNELRVRRLAVQSGQSLDFTYDLDGLLNYVAPTTGTPFPPLTIARSVLDGHIESTTLGTVTTTESVDVDPTTPGFGDYLGHTVAVGGTTFYQSSYTHDRLGRIVGWNETIDGTTRDRSFTYDDAGRLIEVRDGVGTQIAEFAYDDNGNRTLADAGGVRHELGVDIGCGVGLTDAANDQDQLCRYGDYLYAFDDNGRLAEKSHVTDPSDVTEYTYAGDGRLLRVELPFGGSIIDYVYDATGRRIARIADGVLDRGWLYKDGINPIAQLDATGAVEATFVYATRPHVPDFMVKSDGTTYRFVTDHLGSVRALVDASTGTVAERIDYDEWGNVTFASSAWTVQPFGFAGGLHDAATGLVRFGVRDYDPITGRWTAKEPLGFDGGDTNLYRYVGADPVNRVDPTGEYWWIIPVLAFGVASDSADSDSAPLGGLALRKDEFNSAWQTAPTVAVLMAIGARARFKPRALKACPPARLLTSAEIAALRPTGAQRDLIDRLFRDGIDDPALTRTTLENYATLARNAIADPMKATSRAVQEQTRRLKLIEQALKARRGS